MSPVSAAMSGPLNPSTSRSTSVSRYASGSSRSSAITRAPSSVARDSAATSSGSSTVSRVLRRQSSARLRAIVASQPGNAAGSRSAPRRS